MSYIPPKYFHVLTLVPTQGWPISYIFRTDRAQFDHHQLLRWLHDLTYVNHKTHTFHSELNIATYRDAEHVAAVHKLTMKCEGYGV